MTLTAIAAIGLLEICSSFAAPSQISWRPVLDQPLSGNLAIAFGSAMTPVLFAYGGWQTSSFLAGEVRDAPRILPRALVLGVLGVIAVYVSVNFVYLRALGPEGLATTTTPASSVMRIFLGARGAQIIAAGISFSALGFLAQSILTAPRVYFAMAQDRVFFQSVARVHPRTHVPVIAIALQGACAIIIALTGTYAQVVNYVVAMDCIFFGLTAVCLFVLRQRTAADNADAVSHCVPGHPWTTLLFIAAEWMVVVSTFVHDPKRSFIGLGIAFAGLPAYFLWRARKKAPGPKMSESQRTKRSEYMEWAKTRSQARFNLATSGLTNVPLAEFPLRVEDLEITSSEGYGYKPLLERLAHHTGAPEECIVTAAGTSMANHLAMAAVLDPGDEVVIEQPTYGLLVDVANYLGASVKRFTRKFDAGFAVEPAEIEKVVITNKTRLIVLSNLHNPSGALIAAETLHAIAEIAQRVGAHVLVDEVYLEMLFDGECAILFSHRTRNSRTHEAIRLSSPAA